MSEIEGYVLIHAEDKTAYQEMCKEFIKDNKIVIGDDKYEIWNVSNEDILDIQIYTSEYSITEELSEYIRKKYKPDILISTFSKNAYLKNKKTTRKKAFDELAKLSPKIGFYLHIDRYKYKEAYNILKDNEEIFTESFAGVPNYERCFFGDYAPLMEYAVDRGYYNNNCHYYENDTRFHEDAGHVLHRLIKCSDLTLLEKALKLGADPNGRDGDETLLHNLGWRAFDEQFDINIHDFIKLLKSYGGDFNAKDWEGKTPFFSFASGIEEYIGEYDEEIINIVDDLIKGGASVDGFDKSGAGLLTYFKKLKKAQELILKSNPELKPYSEKFDIESYVLDQAHIYKDNLPEDLDQFFSTCIELEYIDFMFEKERVKVLKGLSAYQLYKILDSAIHSPHIITVLEGFLKNDLPVYIEYDNYYDSNTDDSIDESCNSMDVAKLHKKQNIMDFYKSIEDKQYKKIVLANPRIGSSDYDYKIA